MNAIIKPLHAVLLCLGLAAATLAHADFQPCPDSLINPNVSQPTYRDEIVFSPYTAHYSYSSEHKPVVLAGYARHLPGDTFCGVSLFKNSFGQPSVYAFVGKTYNNIWAGHPNIYASVTAGMLYGYVGQFKNKVPLNFHGFSPAIIPALGYRLTPQDAVELQFLGNSDLMFGYSRKY